MQVLNGYIIKRDKAEPLFIGDKNASDASVLFNTFGSGIGRVRSISRGKFVKGVHTGLVTYDRRISRAEVAFIAGNVSSNFQLSSYVRPSEETNCNGKVFGSGALRDFDLKQFDSYTRDIREWYEANEHKTMHKSTIAYLIRDVSKGKVIVRGWLVTEVDGRLLVVRNAGTSARGRDCNAAILSEATRVLTHQNLICDKPIAEVKSNSEVQLHCSRLQEEMLKLIPEVTWTI